MITKLGKKLSAKERNSLSDDDFALPGRRYPIQDINHARAALSMVAKHGTPQEQATVRRKVHARYPEIGEDD
jgi:hypothetical protein